MEKIISSLHLGDKTAATTCLPNDHMSPTIFDVTRATVHSARGAMKMGESRKRMAATADGDSSESSIRTVNRTAPIPKMTTRQAMVAATAAKTASACDAGKEAGHSVVRPCRRWSFHVRHNVACHPPFKCFMHLQGCAGVGSKYQ